MQAAVRGIGTVAAYSEGNEIDAERAALVPQEYIGRLLSPEETRHLIERIGSAVTQDAPAAEPKKNGD